MPAIGVYCLLLVLPSVAIAFSWYCLPLVIGFIGIAFHWYWALFKFIGIAFCWYWASLVLPSVANEKSPYLLLLQDISQISTQGGIPR
jgi:hypothetical protein